MFFIILEPVEGDENIDLPKKNKGEENSRENGSAGFFRSTIDFQGDYSGEITLFLPTPLARSMTANFLGFREEEVTESQALDMAGEITNMISGNLFSLQNKKEGSKLSMPKTEIVSTLGPQVQDQGSPRSLMADFYGEAQRIRVKVQFDSGKMSD